MKLGDISVSYVELMKRASATQGFDASDILSSYQLPSERLALAGNRVSIPRFMRVGKAVMDASGSPCLGLRMGQMTGPSVMGLAGWVAHSSSTVREACDALIRYELLCSFNARGRSSFVVEQGEGVLQFYSISPYNHYNRFVVDMVLTGWKKLLEDMTASHPVAELQFEFAAPDYIARYSDYVDVPIRFDAGRNALLLRHGALDQPLLHPCASQNHWLTQQANAELERVRRGLSVREQVARALTPLLAGRTPELAELARQLGKPAWTLKRMLAAENSHYQQVLDDTRCELALAYLRETGLAVGEIAYLTGFGSATAFQRAFKRWTGKTPRQARQSME